MSPAAAVTSTADQRKSFHALHADGRFVIPKPWHAGGADAAGVDESVTLHRSFAECPAGG